MEYYGWQYNAGLVAERERITLDEAYKLPYLQFLNDLAYVKSYNAHMREVNKAKP
jgi:hypothetical protein